MMILKRLVLLILFVGITFSMTHTSAQEDTRRISYNETLEAVLVRNTVDRWTFEGQAGDTIAITMMSDAFDAFLRLMGPDGQEVAYNDDYDYQLELSAYIGLLLLPQTGTYTIEARGFDRRAEGSYTLTLEDIHAALSYRPATNIDAFIGAPQGDVWPFYGMAGDTVLLILYPYGFTGELRLLTPSGAELLSTRAEPQTQAPHIFILPETGTYNVIIRDINGRSSHRYELSLEETAPEENKAQNQILAYGESVQGEITDVEERHVYLFQAEAGEIITASMITQGFEPSIQMIDPNGRVVLETDWPDGTRVEIGAMPIFISGTYTLSAGEYTTYFSSTDELIGGIYELYIGRADVAPQPPLTYGQREAGVLMDSTPQRWIFDGEAGEIVVITVASELYPAEIDLLDIYGRTLARSFEAGSNFTQIAPTVLPKTGTYSILIRSTRDYLNKYLIGLEQATPSAGDLLRYGEPVSAELLPGEQTRWHFEANAGDILTLTMSSSDFDAFLRMLDTEGVEMAQNDDYDGLNAQIGPILITQTGIYTVVGSAVNNRGGDYVLLVDLEA